MQENTPHDQENVPNDPNEQTRLLNDWLAEKKENEPEKLFNAACEFSERRRLTPEKRLIFLQDAWCCAFREILRDMSDEELARGVAVSEDSVDLFTSLCSNYSKQKITLEQRDRNNLSRRLDVERRAKIGSRPFDAEPLQIEPNEKRGLSSLGNVKDSRATIRTKYDVSKQISNSLLVSESATSNFKPRPTLETRTTGEQGTHSGQKDVFLGTQVETSQEVAFKVSRGGTNDAAMVREAEFQARIGHQGVPTIISLNKEGVPIIVEPFIKGKSWASLIDSQTTEEKLDILVQVGSIMAYTHRESKIAHGDLKPENVMIGEYGEVYVIDWGYAINLEDDEEKRFIFGYTKAYCPPEVYLPKGCNDAPKPAMASADVYMLGGILCQIVVSSRKTFNEILLEKSKYEVPGWKNYGEFPEFPGVSNEMREILEKALQYKPENRYRDAGEFVDALKKFRKMRRFYKNREEFTKWKAQTDVRLPYFETNKEKKLRTAQVTNVITSCVNEFMIIRKIFEYEYEERKKNPSEDSSYWEVLNDEIQARSILLDYLISERNYEQANVFVATQADVFEHYANVIEYCNKMGRVSTVCDQIVPKFLLQIKQINNGYARIRRRYTFWINIIFFILLITIGSLMWYDQKNVFEHSEVDRQVNALRTQDIKKRNLQMLISEGNRRLKEEEEDARFVLNQKLFDTYKHTLKVMGHKSEQRETTVWENALELIGSSTKKNPQCYNWLDVASESSIFPQKAKHPILYSDVSDGRLSISSKLGNNFEVWDFEKSQPVAYMNMAFPRGTITYLFTNPLLENPNIDKSILVSRFFFFNTGGDVWIVSKIHSKTN